MNFPRLILKSGRDKAVRNRHPWIFSGAVKHRPKAGDGHIVAVYSNKEEFLGLGHFAPQATLICRMFHFGDTAPEIGPEYWHAKLRAAQAYRREVIDSDLTDGYRLVHAEGDGLPGVVIDIYGNSASMQLRTAGAMRLELELFGFLQEELGMEQVYVRYAPGHEGERSDRWMLGEGLPLIFREHGLQFNVDIEKGQKTGFFLDQRENRKLLRGFSAGRKVLNAFSYSGAFSVYALAGGAQYVESVDISASAAELARANVALNFGADARHEARKADCFRYLKEMPESEFDLIILDPPAFTKHISTVKRAARGYKEINLRAMQKIAPGGFLFTYSCSQHISTDLFRKIVFGAAVDAGREVRLVCQMVQAPDHPVSIFHPEGEYLKGLLLHIN